LTSIVDTIGRLLTLAPRIETVRPRVLGLVNRLTIHTLIPFRHHDVLLETRNRGNTSNPIPTKNPMSRFPRLFVTVRQRRLETLHHIEPLIPSLGFVVLGLHEDPKRGSLRDLPPEFQHFLPKGAGVVPPKHAKLEHGLTSNLKLVKHRIKVLIEPHGRRERDRLPDFLRLLTWFFILNARPTQQLATNIQVDVVEIVLTGSTTHETIVHGETNAIHGERINPNLGPTLKSRFEVAPELFPGRDVALLHLDFEVFQLHKGSNSIRVATLSSQPMAGSLTSSFSLA
jgi:hypothetical protein